MKTELEKSRGKQIARDLKAARESRIESAQVDFKKMMIQIEPFIRKSEILIVSTEGKWCDTTSVSDTVILLNHE